jgi:protein-L-isoaspartate(D-aspartate) O-methyltransferase
MDRIASHRLLFSQLITAAAGLGGQRTRLQTALASTPREKFLGPGPWKIFAGLGLIETPTDDPAFLYQDVVVAISPERKINNGQPMLHAVSLAALNIQEGESILHIGVGTGYYTALLAQLAGPQGSVTAYECEPDLAEAASRNLMNFANVTVHSRSGAEPPLSWCDAIYVSAGATSPLDVWLDALRPNGRLLFPLTPAEGPGGTPGVGAMLLIVRLPDGRFTARFVCQAAFIPCVGARNPETAAKLSAAFKRGELRSVRSLRRNAAPDDTCWCSGPTWWLSTTE